LKAEKLNVIFREQLVGTLELEPTGDWSFRYSPEWLAFDKRFPISLSLPLADEVYVGVKTRNFFANLLPEGTIRRLVAQKLGISEDNDYELLKALGGECAGALSVVIEEPIKTSSRYKKLSAEEIRRMVSAHSALSLVVGEKHRLSLAGAQDKLPVYVKGDAVYLPEGNSPSSHILKFLDPRFAHLPTNEVFTMFLAHELGLTTADVSLFKVGRHYLCLVKRYDRVLDSDGRIIRLHQEDLCQSLGVSHSQKYEGEGGPSFAQCYEVISKYSHEPLLDSEALLKWLLFNVIAGNADGHAKNISLLISPHAGVRLSPFYDLVCTRVYRDLERNLAMSIGGESHPDLIKKDNWRILAEQINVKTKYLFELVDRMTEQIPDGLKMALNQFESRFGKHPSLQGVVIAIRKQARRIRQLIK
jgi:serine/threonine-protein kinase HipA